jgi:cell division GTPase FtsZ
METGRDRSSKASYDALAGYETATTAETATKVLMQVTGPEDLLLKDVNDAVSIIKAAISPMAEVIYGVARDLNLDDEIEVILCGGGRLRH